MRKLTYTSILFVSLMLNSCGVLIWREIECRQVEVDYENYFFPLDNGENVVFIVNGEERVFTIEDQFIDHTKAYFSDTGCDCADQSVQLITDGKDSIWFDQISYYIEKNPATTAQKVVFNIEDEWFGFNEANLEYKDQVDVNGITINDVQIYSSDKQDLTKVIIAKGIGIVKMEFSNGDVWINKNLNEIGKFKFSRFRFKEVVCG